MKTLCLCVGHMTPVHKQFVVPNTPTQKQASDRAVASLASQL
jgi:hypothetical protein